MSLPRALAFVAFPSLAVLLPAAVDGQVTPVEPEPDSLPALEAPAVPSGDSAALLRDARAAQARFERRRVRHFPMVWGAGGGECDEIVGRMCIRLGSGSDWEPEEEEEVVQEERRELLEALEGIARRIPGDEWVLGQRVHYLGEAGLWDRAEELTRNCQAASSWWCAALLGYVLHHQERFPEAALAFEEALGAMDSEQAEEWRSLERLLDVDGYRLYRNLDETARRALEERVWTLANPLLLIPGNDHRTSHFSRHVASTIQERARNPHNIRWGSDLAEITVRYGTPYGWQQERPRWNHVGPPRVLGRHDPRSRGLLPPGRHLQEAGALPPGEWTPDQRRVRTRYAPEYSPRIHPMDMDAQVARFRRGDSILVIAAWEVEGSLDYDGADWKPAPEDGYRSGLFLIPMDPSSRPPPSLAEGPQGGTQPTATERSPGGRASSGSFPSGASVSPEGRSPTWDVRAIREGDGVPGTTGETGRSGVLEVQAPAGDYVLSLETLHSEERRAWRLRHGVRDETLPPHVIALSELLLTHPAELQDDRVDSQVDSGGGALPELSDWIEWALPRAEIGEGQAVGVVWEVYGLIPQERTLRFRLTVGREDRGLLRRAGEWLRLVEPEPPVVTAWSEPAPETGGTFLRSVTLDLDALEPGEYELRLELEPVGRTPAVTKRTLRIAPR